MDRRRFLATTAAGASTSALAAGNEKATAASANALRAVGVVGDGVADDTSAIQTALESGASPVYLPRGKYLVSSLRIGPGASLSGDGPGQTILIQRADAKAPVVRNVSGASGIRISNLSIRGSTEGRDRTLRCGIQLDATVRHAVIENVDVETVVDWGYFVCGSHIRLINCRGSNVVGALGPDAVRAVFLIGASQPMIPVTNVRLEGCLAADCDAPYTDGFILECGTDIVMTDCRVTNISYTGFKLKTDGTRIESCYAEKCLVGFQTQGALKSLALYGNVAIHNGGAGFQFNQNNPAVKGSGWIVANNLSIENGTNASAGTRYGFAFENADGCTTENVIVQGNIAVDNQAARTQMRGISFGKAGTFTGVFMGGNVCRGNTIDNYAGASLASDASLRDWSAGTGALSYPTGIQRLDFCFELKSVAELPAKRELVSSRGFLSPRDGFVRGLTVRASAPISAGVAKVSVLVNDTAIEELSTAIDVKGSKLRTLERPPFAVRIAAGDLVKVGLKADRDFQFETPLSIDVCVEICS